MMRDFNTNGRRTARLVQRINTFISYVDQHKVRINKNNVILRPNRIIGLV